MLYVAQTKVLININIIVITTESLFLKALL